MGTLKAEKLIEFLREQHPELSKQTFRVISSGHQNLIIVVGERLIFRFPLTSDLTSLKLEERLLPQLGKRLPLPIPQFRYVLLSKQNIHYVGYPIIPGESLEAGKLNSLNEPTRRLFAKQIAEFLTSLHTFTGDPITRVDRRRFQAEWRRNWSGYYRAVELNVFPKIGKKERTWIMQVFDDYLYPSEHFKFTPSLIHGDFKNDHILYDPQAGRLTGVIDFGQMKMGDPSYDYHDLCISYGEPFARAVLNEYKGPADPTFLERCSAFYANILRFSSMIIAAQTKNESKFKLRHEWLKQKARDADL
ncbi:aminoglycoside phosphotransferase family protein [Paenibacillus sp. GYB004]|uniref:phosphotransferase family protein n=1 Tax=Paenibacillus sp. GYB004 TaxID=2994393 RepID=UPI002F965795